MSSIFQPLFAGFLFAGFQAFENRSSEPKLRLVVSANNQLESPEQIEAPNEPSDEQLVLRAKAGDRLAMSTIYRRYAPLVTDMATRMLQRRAEADDVVQDTFATVLTSLDKVREGQPLKAWLITVAVHRIQRRFRMRSFTRWVSFEESDDAPLEATLVSGTAGEVQAEIHLLGKAMKKLSNDERIAFSLRVIEGMELTEVAEAMNLSLATVKRRLHDADFTLRCELHIDRSFLNETTRST